MLYGKWLWNLRCFIEQKVNTWKHASFVEIVIIYNIQNVLVTLNNIFNISFSLALILTAYTVYAHIILYRNLQKQN